MKGEGGSVKKRYGEEEEEEIDVFSKLPDSLIHEILSFLNVKEAAITSVLSKRWEFLWADSPNLELSDEGEEVREFVSWVNRTLSLRKVNYLNKFHVTLEYYESFSSDVDAWVKFAAENNVKQLNLHLHCVNDLYQPPEEAMYCCPSLTKLSLMGCTLSMDSKASIEWQSLTNLHLSVVYVDEHLLDQIFSSCPVLHTVILEACQGFDRLEINNPSVHTLKIQDCDYDKVAPPLKISVPYIHHFNVSRHEEGRKMQLVGKFSSLVRVDIDFEESPSVSSNVDVMHDVEQLLQRVKDVKELYVGLHFIKVVSMIGFTLPQSTRELLVVGSDIECHKSNIYGIIRLLESSPNLETLVIKGSASEENFAIEDPAAVEIDLKCNLLRLKTISIINFADPNGEPMLTLARILLRRATGLEKMDVVVDVAENNDFMRIDKELQICPRTSIKAKVMIKRQAIVSR